MNDENTGEGGVVIVTCSVLLSVYSVKRLTFVICLQLV